MDIPQALFQLLLLCYLFQGRDSVSYHPSALPELGLLIFKVSKVKPSWFSKPNVIGDSSSQCGSPVSGVPGMGSAFLSQCLQCPSHLWLVSWGVWFPTILSPLLPFSMWPPLYDCGKSVLQVFRSFPGLVALMWLLSRCSNGTR